MPRLIPVLKYEPLNPYDYRFDNLPIETIIINMNILNGKVENNQVTLENSVGTAGSLDNRLNTSLNPDGSLQTTAIDDALHHIAEHMDGGGYVRMSDSERFKLNLIEHEATNLSVTIHALSSTPLVWPEVNHNFEIGNSDTVAWRYEGGKVYAETTFGISTLSIAAYDVAPVKVSGTTYQTSTVNTPYKPNTLRVYVNGLRLTGDVLIGGFTYTEVDPDLGTFSFNVRPSSSDTVRIDFDQPL